jgi:peroxiredoxin
MKKLLCIVVIVTVLFSCKNEKGSDKFIVTGNIKNVPDQKIYLEEIYFSQKDPEVADTADIKNGKFTLSALAPQEGLYRLRLEKEKTVFIFINDQKDISLSADYNNLSMKTVSINSPANALLKNFIITTDSQRTYLQSKGAVLQQFSKTDKNDSIYNALLNEYDEKSINYKKYIINYIDTTSNAIMALFALGYTRDIEPEKLAKPIAGLSNRFPGNTAITSVIAQFNQLMQQTKQQEAAKKAQPQPGDMAPDISMPDTEGKLFSLSSLKGKYVLVDFWASWCGPCRQENPNVVMAYNKYKNKNFTVLGVSLDKNKEAWLDAIKTDNLTWTHISDLKQWGSAAVSLYGFEGIPYNALVDPQGKIIATSLRGAELENKLAEVLK